MAAATVGALARIARRDALHHRTHSLLVVSMIALPVAGLVASGTLLDTLQHRSISHLFLQFEPEIRWQFRMLYATTLVAAVLMAGAAVTIAARRQLRALGLLAAAGARGRQLGAVVILQAGAVGLAGALVGVPAGLLLAWGLLPLVAAAIQVDAGPLLVGPGRLLLAGALGLLVAVAAALIPAIGAARLPVTAALTARQPPPQQRRWLLTVGGLVGVLAGLGLVVVQARWMWLWQPWNRPAVLVGVAACSPALVALLGRSARHLPATLRLAVRDLARHPTRSAAAVAAITVGLAVPTILGVQAAQWVAYTRAYAPRQFRSDQVLTYSPAATAAVTQSLPGARQAPFTTAKDAGGREVTVHGPVIDQDNIGASRGLAIGDQRLLVAMGGEQAAAAFAGGAVVAFGPGLVPDGQVTLAITDLPRPARRITVPAVEVTTGAYTGEALPSFVISRQTAQRLGLPGLTTPPRYLVRAARPLSAAQHDQLRRLQGRFADIAWEPTDLAQEVAQGLRTIILALLAAAAIIALGSVAAACALALSEARQDLTTLGQLGAPLGMTRRLAAAEAWLLAGLGAPARGGRRPGPRRRHHPCDLQHPPKPPDHACPDPLRRALDAADGRHPRHPSPRRGGRQPAGPQPSTTPASARWLTHAATTSRDTKNRQGRHLGGLRLGLPGVRRLAAQPTLPSRRPTNLSSSSHQPALSNTLLRRSFRSLSVEGLLRSDSSVPVGRGLGRG